MSSRKTPNGHSDTHSVAYEPPQLTAIGTIEELTLVETVAVTNGKSHAN